MEVEVVAGALVHQGRVLAARRREPSGSSRRWELPGGKREPGESSAAAVVRELREELGCEVTYGRPLEGRSDVRPGLVLTGHVVHLAAGEPLPLDHDAVRWLAPEELDSVAWLVPDLPFVEQLRDLLLDGAPLVGGNVGGAVRVGRTVRRPVGPWSPAVHALLDHFEVRGLGAVPRMLGHDERDRETLTYLPGRVLEVDTETPPEPALADMGSWLRRAHDAARGFEHPGPWRTTERQPGPGELICHHDAAPYNVALGGDGLSTVVGVFDWDMAGPSLPVDDIAFAAWTWIPLFRPAPDGVCGRRLAVLAEAYADPEVRAVDILDAVAPRLQQSVDVITAGQRAGDPGMVNLAGVGEPARTAARLDAFRVRLPALRRATVEAAVQVSPTAEEP